MPKKNTVNHVYFIVEIFLDALAHEIKHVKMCMQY